MVCLSVLIYCFLFVERCRRRTADILSLVSIQVGRRWWCCHGTMWVQVASFVVVHGRSFFYQIYHRGHHLPTPPPQSPLPRNLPAPLNGDTFPSLSQFALSQNYSHPLAAGEGLVRSSEILHVPVAALAKKTRHATHARCLLTNSEERDRSPPQI